MYWFLVKVCYNESRDVMKLKIKIYSEMNNLIENEEYLAIINENIIKYIDLTNNKMFIDINNNIIKRENNDYIFTIDFENNNILIFIKNLKKEFNKKIQTIKLEKNSQSFKVRYRLIDENIINEFYIKYYKLK